MTFEQLTGQEEVKQRLLHEVETGRLPHALLLAGPEGNGGFALAWALADKLLEHSPLVGKLQHPDLYFSFPVYKKDSKSTTSSAFAKQWRAMVQKTPFFDYNEWTEAIGAENHQLYMYVEESDELFKRFSFKANQGGYKVSIIWLPERMNEQCANKILKLLEEPPAQSVFILVCEHPELLLTTIRSRCQLIDIPKMRDEDIEQILVRQYNIDSGMAHGIARASYGNMSVALRQIMGNNAEQEQFLELFKSLMRLSYMRKVREMKLWSEEVAGMGRERQKRFLTYCQRMIRENFIYNFGNPELNYMSSAEADFAINFAPFINENNVIGIMDELQLCYRDIIQNANAKIVFFDFSLKMIVLIKNR